MLGIQSIIDFVNTIAYVPNTTYISKELTILTSLMQEMAFSFLQSIY